MKHEPELTEQIVLQVQPELRQRLEAIAEQREWKLAHLTRRLLERAVQDAFIAEVRASPKFSPELAGAIADVEGLFRPEWRYAIRQSIRDVAKWPTS